MRLATTVATASVRASGHDVGVVLGVVGGAVPILDGCEGARQRFEGNTRSAHRLSTQNPDLSALTTRLDLSLFENLRHDIHVLVRAEVILELLLRWVAHDALGTLSGVEDLERVNNVGEGDRLVASLPLLVDVGVGDDDLVEVGGVDVRLVDGLSELL